jgi:hypothetical protein
MCYSSMEDYGWRNKREANRKPEARQETPPDHQEPHYTAQDFTFWAFPRRWKERGTQEPAAERTHEKV